MASPFHVVVGAGPAGLATTALLAGSGERVRQVTRSGHGVDHPLVDRVAADATDPDRLTGLAEGATTLVNCAVPPYDRWLDLLPPLAASLLATAERTGAGYVMLGNVYGYGPVDGPITEDRALAPTTDKGKVRADMWHDALAAHDEGRARVTEVRASDFLGPGAFSIFTLLALPGILAGQPAAYPADLDVAHAWAYTEDVAATLVAAGRHEAAWGRPWHVPAASHASARELATRLAERAGAPEPQLSAMPEDVLRQIGESDPVAAEIPEMQYLYREPLLLGSAATEAALGVVPSTLDEVLAATVGAAS